MYIYTIMAKKATKALDVSTEEKIKAAAKKLFTKNGFEATRTRDIAEEAGINLALLNYYFRSKQKLYEVIMRENITLFLGGMLGSIQQMQQLSLEKKIEILIEKYIDMLLANPDLPLFILSVIRTKEFEQNDSNDPLFKAIKQMRSYFMEAILQEMEAGRIKKVHPLHIIANLMGLVVFPFAASAMLQSRMGISKKEFEQLMQERKKMIPIWLKAMFYK